MSRKSGDGRYPRHCGEPRDGRCVWIEVSVNFQGFEEYVRSLTCIAESL